MTTEATQTTPEVPAMPAPDTPEYAALMAARAEQGTLTPEITAPEVKVEPTPADPNAPTPKLTDAPAGTEPPKETEESKEGEPAPYDFAKAYGDGSLLTEFNAEKPNEAVIGAFAKALGITVEQAQEMQSAYRAGNQALVAQAETRMFDAAGGKEQFNAMIAWGQQNLSQADKVRYEGMLNGPDALTAIEILQARMGASRDPRLVNVNAQAVATVAGFRDQSELVTAMADPRYQSSEAYRRDVAAKLAVSRI